MSQPLGSEQRLTTSRRVAPAVALFFLAPLIGEFLLGNISIDGIVGLFVLAPMYGGGALLIREAARRTGRGWPTMILLGVAYSVIEEGLVTQLLFNPSYYGLNLMSSTYIPALGMSAMLTLNVLTLHTVWSMSVSIALVESFVPGRSTTPWLGRLGLAITAVLFLLGSAFLFHGEYVRNGFLASMPQLIGAASVIVALIGIAFTIGRASRPRHAGAAPSPWRVAAASLVATSLFMVVLFEVLPGWVSVAFWFVLVAASVALVARWSRRQGWGDAHRLALAGGALLTYAWSAFPQAPVTGSTGVIDLVGNIVFALIAVALLAAAALSLNRSRLTAA